MWTVVAAAVRRVSQLVYCVYRGIVAALQSRNKSKRRCLLSPLLWRGLLGQHLRDPPTARGLRSAEPPLPPSISTRRNL